MWVVYVLAIAAGLGVVSGLVGFAFDRLIARPLLRVDEADEHSIYLRQQQLAAAALGKSVVRLSEYRR